jgi:hypothetical protein
MAFKDFDLNSKLTRARKAVDISYLQRMSEDRGKSTLMIFADSKGLLDENPIDCLDLSFEHAAIGKRLSHYCRGREEV